MDLHEMTKDVKETKLHDYHEPIPFQKIVSTENLIVSVVEYS